MYGGEIQLIEQNSDILSDNQKELICQYFLDHCTSKRDIQWGIVEQKVFEEQFSKLIPDWEKRIGLRDTMQIRQTMKELHKRITTQLMWGYTIVEVVYPFSFLLKQNYSLKCA